MTYRVDGVKHHDDRRVHQAYNTPPEIARMLVKVTQKHKLVKTPFYIEPSAGTAAFFRFLPARRRQGFDIQPSLCRTHRYTCQNFLTVTRADLKSQPRRANMVIGNPPFSSLQGGDLAMRFLQHAARLADTVAFILPLPFVRLSRQTRIPADMHLVFQHTLPPNMFFNKRNPEIRTVFQIWQRQPRHPPIPRIHSPTFSPSTRFLASDLTRVKYGTPGINVILYRWGDTQQIGRALLYRDFHLRGKKTYLIYLKTRHPKQVVARLQQISPALRDYAVQTATTGNVTLHFSDILMFYTGQARADRNTWPVSRDTVITAGSSRKRCSGYRKAGDRR